MPRTIGKDKVSLTFSAVTLRGNLVHDDAQRALWLETNEGPEHVSVNLDIYDLKAGPGEVFIKDWSEHAGLAQNLIDQGLVKIINSYAVGPFRLTAHHVKVAAL